MKQVQIMCKKWIMLRLRHDRNTCKKLQQSFSPNNHHFPQNLLTFFSIKKFVDWRIMLVCNENSWIMSEIHIKILCTLQHCFKDDWNSHQLFTFDFLSQKKNVFNLGTSWCGKCVFISFNGNKTGAGIGIQLIKT